MQEPFHNKQRLLPFKYINNFRDVGGYQTSQSQSIAWRKIYRSGQPGPLEEDDIQLFHSLGIRLILDLRSDDEESGSYKTYLTDISTQIINLPVIPGGTKSFMAVLRGSEADSDEIARFMCGLYSKMVLDYADIFRNMFRAILACESGPILIHCAAGKDRTGIAVALLMSALDVPVQTITDDYMLSKEYLDNVQLLGRFSRQHGLDGSERYMPLIQVRRDYLNTAFAVIKSECGGIDHYLEQRLGLGKEQRRLLKSRFLVQVPG